MQPLDPGRLTLAKRVFDAAHLTGTFTLRSGVVSNEYFDKYRFETDPILLRDICLALADKMPTEVDALAGLELGGVPIATVLSQLTGLPVFFVRKQAKAYGTMRIAEGGSLAGRRVLIVEDVVTSGGAILDSAGPLRAEGALIGPVICVIDRQAGGADKLAAQGLALDALFTMTDLQAATGPS